ncbi:MAG: T9SS type A sorting domain-containing protein [Sphingobacteriales bacterium]|nr:MAG: T9SS type A sorting domain-containing protein [Sphingobacteriales bacterium]
MRETNLPQGAKASMFAILLLGILYVSPLRAQKIMSPSNTESILDSAVAGVTSISCDMFDCPIAGGKMMAVAYDSAGYVCVKTWHSSNPAKITRIAPLPGTNPDVIIADDKLYPGKRAFVLVSCIRNNRVEVRRYAITIASKTGYSVNPTAGILAISPKTAIATSPRLEAFPDTSLTINGYPSYTDIVVSYVENGDSLIALKGHSRSSATGFARSNIATLDSTTTQPDVAAITNVVNSDKIGLFTYTTATGLYLKEYNFTTSTASSPIWLSSNPQIHNAPRIEAMNFYDPSATAAKWHVVSSEYNIPTGKWDIKAYNSLTAYNCSDILGSMNSSYTPSVSAGMGTLGSAFFTGNKNYVFGWKQDNTNNVYANYVDVSTGNRANSTGTIYYNDTTYYQDTITLYDTTKFVNTNYTIVKDTSYLLDTTYTYITDTTFKNGNNGKNPKEGDSVRILSWSKKKGWTWVTVKIAKWANAKSNKGKNNKETVVDTIDIITTIDTLDIIYTTDTIHIAYSDSIVITARDSIFTVIVVTPQSKIGNLVNCYQINNDSCAANVPLALSSATNTGNGVLAVWHDGSMLKYKLVGNTSGFKGDAGGDGMEEGPFKKTQNDPSGGGIANAAHGVIEIYPNPGHDIVTVKGTGVKAVMVTDVAGKIVLKADLQQEAFNVSGLMVGTYIVHFICEEGIIVPPAKFVRY